MKAGGDGPVNCGGCKLPRGPCVAEEVEAALASPGPAITTADFYAYGEICPSAVQYSCDLHHETMTLTYVRRIPPSPLNPLLARQIRKHLPHIAPDDPAWQGFFAAVGSAYLELEGDRELLEHTLEGRSNELTEANEKLRRESERQLASLSRYYQQTLELQQGMILCVHLTPAGFRHTLCRGQLLQRLGITPADVEGKLLEEVAGPSQAVLLNAAFTRAWSGESVSLSFTTEDGIELFAHLRPRLENETVKEIIASCIEITPLKEAERELRTAKESAEAADRAKGEFLAVMSHEIRTPLNAVLGFSEILKESSLTPKQLTWVNTISTASESLLALINDILDFSKIDAERLTIHPAPVSLPPLLEAVVALFKQRAAAKNITLRADLAPDVPAFVNTDAQRLRQILVNLVGNAVKFTPRGSVRISVGLFTPAVAPDQPCVLRFTVSDTGIGIQAERRDRLFKAFSQVDSSTTRHYGGTGLGLAISQRLTHLLGGEIGFDSQPGVGSTFFFTISAAAVTASIDPSHTVPAAVVAPPLSAHSGVRILVAEDRPENRLLIETYLREHGYFPDVVANGREAIEAAKKQDYDFILMDILMPESDGYEATKEIRRHGAGAHQPRIYGLTANVFPEDRARCREAGMDGFLTKPINIKNLLHVLSGPS